MEFSVKKYDLLAELNLTQGVVERKTTIPILGNLLCEATRQSGELTATDLELSICDIVRGKNKEGRCGNHTCKEVIGIGAFIARR